VTTAWRSDLNIASDSSKSAPARREAIRRIADSDEASVLEALLELAQDEGLEESVAREVGSTLARILWRQGRVLEAPLHLFTGAVGDAFDESVAEAQRRSQ
jgi:hypothetical protein